MVTYNLSLTSRWITDHPHFKNGTPSNRIIYKTLCGLGATHGEALIYKRHSIILLPNTPVLIGKKTAKEPDGSLSYPNIFIVYEDIKAEELETYLNDDSIEFKKILCTPEAYKHKVRETIIKNERYDLFKDFFMLIDECDSLVKTVFFRGKIVSPLTDFFQFDKKAMISATPIIPSDPRFEQNNFKILKVVPQSEYKKHIDVIHTNNIAASLKYTLNQHPDQQIFIFLNSTKLSAKLMKKLSIEKEANIYCSEEKVRELKKKMGIRNAKAELKDLKKYNFLTSRFFSALDIKLGETAKPTVIMITDLHRAPFSLLDSFSDSIQIVGRFRDGVENIIHITNTKPDIEFKTPLQADKQISESYECFKKLLEVKGDSHTEYGLITAKQAIERNDFFKFTEETGLLSYFACDSFHLHQKIKSQYRNITLLAEAYIETNYFIPKVLNRLYDADDALIDILETEDISRAKLNEAVATLLLYYANRNNAIQIPCVDEELANKLRLDYPVQAKYFDKLGYAKMKALEFNDAKMSNEVNMLNNENILSNPLLIKAVKSLYKVGDNVLKTECRKSIGEIYSEFGHHKSIKSTEIQKYYEVTDSTMNTTQGKKHKWGILAIK